jgi:hypothetical protein
VVSKPYPGPNPSDAADQDAEKGPENRPGIGGRSVGQRSAETEGRRLPDQRSAVTNAKRLFVEAGDGRGPWARRMRDVIELHISDLGGVDAASEAERSIIRRIATLTIELERLEAKFSTTNTPRDSDIELYQRLANTLRRLLEAIGIKRVPRDVTTLEGFLGKLNPETPPARMIDNAR